ncbi:MAG TPA: family 20 glycosylhydrolase, partial [Candidatus Acidoferrum sp.]|nr:family 20 glycosylhydrolase [Candidatus Acidoferrum sp.]
MAQNTGTSTAAQLQLVPQPREVVKLTGSEPFRVTRKTKIVVAKKFGRDFAGAQMLVEEIARWTGWKLKVEDAERMPGGSDFIYIGNAMEDSKLREALGTSGLAMQNGFDAQGYAILAERQRILVGGASEQGAFYGVQTLRQLLRAARANGAKAKAGSSPTSAANTAAAGFGMTAKVESGANEAARLVNAATYDSTAGAKTAPLRLASLRQSGVEPPHSKEAGSSPTSAANTTAAGFGMTEKNKNAQNAAPGESRLLEVAMTTRKTQRGILRSADGASLRMTGQEKTAARNAGSSSSTSDYVSELECPAVTIRDWPAMKWRGASVDISRGPIPTLEFMEKQVRTLAAYKLNLYGLYMEDVFTVKGNGIFAPPNALTPEEITQLVEYAKKYYVTVMPELETFGHLHNVLRYDAYSDLAETPHGAVLTPTLPGSYDFIGKLIAQMAPLFPGPFFHIGADETNELGQGKTKDLIAQQGLGQVYLAHIAKLDAMLKPYGKQTMFWADIAEKFPALLPTLPKDLIAVVWTYALKNDVKPDYNARLDPFKNAGLPILVSPGIGNWRKVYPDFNAAFMNIRNTTRDGQKYGAIGQLNTEWKDRGEELGGMDWPGLLFGAACAWQTGESSVEQFMDSYDWAFYRNMDHTFEGALNKLAGTNTLMHGVQLDGTHVDYFWVNPFSKLGANEAEKTAPVVHELRVDAEQAWESLLDNRAKARMNA